MSKRKGTYTQMNENTNTNKSNDNNNIKYCKYNKYDLF